MSQYIRYTFNKYCFSMYCIGMIHFSPVHFTHHTILVFLVFSFTGLFRIGTFVGAFSSHSTLPLVLYGLPYSLSLAGLFRLDQLVLVHVKVDAKRFQLVSLQPLPGKTG